MKYFGVALIAFLFPAFLFSQINENQAAVFDYHKVEIKPHLTTCEGEVLGECSDRQLVSFLQGHLSYPVQAKGEGIEGRVFAKFIINLDGSISDFKILRDIGGGCGDETIRLLQLMNDEGVRWMPGEQAGVPVRVSKEFVLKFTLQPAKKKSSKIRKPSFPSSLNPADQQYAPEIALNRFIYSNLTYPAQAKNHNIDKVVWLLVSIDKKGFVDKIKVSRSVGYGCDEEAVRVIQLMKDQKIKWTPGTKKGKAKQMDIPVFIHFSPSLAAMKKKILSN